jgi:hypothetical protein
MMGVEVETENSLFHDLTNSQIHFYFVLFTFHYIKAATIKSIILIPMNGINTPPNP